MLRHRILVVLTGAWMLLSSCTSSPTPVEGESRGMLFSVLRTDLEFGDPDRTSRRGLGIAGLELAVSMGQDNFQPRGTTFERADFRLLNSHALLRGGGELDGRIRIEGLVGVEYTNFELKLARVGQPSDTDVSNDIGPMLGLQLSVDLVEDLLLVYGRGTKGFGLDHLETEKVEVGLKLDLSESTRVLLAYRWWEYHNENIDFNFGSVDVDLRMTGFVLGLEARF